MAFGEPASPLPTLAPGFNAGFQMGRAIFNQRVTWALSVFTDEVGQDFNDDSQNCGHAITHLAALPICRPDPAQPDCTLLFHLGLGTSALDPPDVTGCDRVTPASAGAAHLPGAAKRSLFGHA